MMGSKNRLPSPTKQTPHPAISVIAYDLAIWKLFIKVSFETTNRIISHKWDEYKIRPYALRYCAMNTNQGRSDKTPLILLLHNFHELQHSLRMEDSGR